MVILKSKYLRLKSLFKKKVINRDIFSKKLNKKITEYERINDFLKKDNNKLRIQKQECIEKVLELKNTNEKIRENYQKISNQKIELQKELEKVTELYDYLKKETFGYNFFSKVASKQILKEAIGKDKK